MYFWKTLTVEFLHFLAESKLKELNLDCKKKKNICLNCHSPQLWTEQNFLKCPSVRLHWAQLVVTCVCLSLLNSIITKICPMWWTNSQKDVPLSVQWQVRSWIRILLINLRRITLCLFAVFRGQTGLQNSSLGVYGINTEFCCIR